MDIVMPGEMDGIAAAEQIRSELGIPFVFLTAYTDPDLIDRAKGLEPLGYIIKPFQEGQITAAIEIALHNDEMARRLRESEGRYRSLVEIIPHGIVETDTDLRITFANRSFLSMHGFTGRELEGMRLHELMAWEDEASEIYAALPSLLQSEPTASPWVWRNRRREGSTIDVQLDWDYKRDADGRVTGFIYVVTDITERLRSEDRPFGRPTTNSRSAYRSGPGNWCRPMPASRRKYRNGCGPRRNSKSSGATSRKSTPPQGAP